MLIAQLLAALIIPFIAVQQQISVRFDRSSEIFLKWLNLVVTCNSSSGVSEYNASKFDTFHDYFDKIVDESLSFRLSVNINSQHEVERDQIFKADGKGYVISEPLKITDFCDEEKPVQCRDGGLEIQDYVFTVKVEMSCTKLEVPVKLVDPKETKLDDSPDEDIQEIEFEQLQVNKKAKKKQAKPSDPTSDHEPDKRKSDEKPIEPEIDDNSSPIQEENLSIKFTIQVSSTNAKERVI